MAARPLASGTVSFGLVSIPVKLYSASESKAAVSFNLLHGACKTRLKQQYVCPKDNEIVPRDQMVKGYEFTKENFVTFTEEELKAMAQAAERAIEITEFVPAAKVDPVYFDSAYYLGPDKGGDKAYHLLVKAMQQTGRSALAKWAARGKQYLVLVRAVPGGLVMQQLLYADEVRPISEVPVGDADVKDAELKLAIQLVEQIASDEFHPENYEDDVKKRYLTAIQRKVDGQEVVVAPEQPRAQVIDLMEALKASLAGKATAAAPVAAVAEARKPAKRARSEAKPLRIASGGRSKKLRRFVVKRTTGGYSSREVRDLLGLSQAQLRSCLRAGFLDPQRGKRGEMRFSLQDIVLLRTARELQAKVPPRRVKRALARLRQQLPSGRPLSGVRITAVGDAVVVRDGRAAWAPESGQGILDFGVAELASRVAPLARRAAREARNDERGLGAEDWFALGLDLEPCDAAQARDAYRRALELDPGHTDARVNLGRLLHEAGHPEAAATHYRLALIARPRDATAAYNLGVALEDLGRPAEAIAAYERAVASDPAAADAHFNLSRLHERAGRKAAALRHLAAYRRLIRA